MEVQVIEDPEVGTVAENVGESVKKKAVAKRDPAAPSVAPPSVADALIELAKDPSIDADKLQRLIDMKYADEDRVSRQTYFEHWSVMQGEFESVQKSKTVKNRDGDKLYAFAPIEDIVSMYGPIIARNGFGWRFKTETLEDGRRCTFCHVTGWGHEEINSVDLPILDSTKTTNSMQQVGSSSTYGERYSFKAAFAVVIAGEDDDGVEAFELATIEKAAEALGTITLSQTADEVRENFSFYIKLAASDDERLLLSRAKEHQYDLLKEINAAAVAMNKAKTAEELLKAFTTYYTPAPDDQRRLITAIKNHRKIDLGIE
jgi:hypothetical protein